MPCSRRTARTCRASSPDAGRVRSGPGQPLDDRRQLVDLAEHERADPEPGAKIADLVDQRIDRADEQMRRSEHLVDRQLDPGAGAQVVDDAMRFGMGVVGDDDLPARWIDVELEAREPLTCRLPHPADLFLVAAQVRLRGSTRWPDSWRGARPTMSASRAARLSVRRPPPPINSGGWGFWTGLGWPSWSVIA